MDHQIVVLFCICDDFLKSIGHYEDRQCPEGTRFVKW